MWKNSNLVTSFVAKHLPMRAFIFTGQSHGPLVPPSDPLLALRMMHVRMLHLLATTHAQTVKQV